MEERTGFGDLAFDSDTLGVAEVDAGPGLPSVEGLVGDSSEEFGTSCHRLAVSLVIHKSDIKASPVVDLSDETGRVSSLGKGI